MSQPIFIINGPNLNRLGAREPHIYGPHRLDDIREMCVSTAEDLGYEIEFRQSNHEGELIDWVQEAAAQAAALVINPAAFGHTSIALLDAVRLVDQPVIEVHLSNITAREPFRTHSHISPAASGVIHGLGALGYVLGVQAACRLANERSS